MISQELKDILHVDWVKYLERKRLFFIYFCFVEIESKQLLEITGFKFSHYLYTYIDDLGSHYRSADDLVKSDAHYMSLVDSNDARLLTWRDEGLAWNKRADELAIKFANKDFVSKITENEFRKYFNEFLQILLYGVTIPYLVLTAINGRLELGQPKKKYQKMIDAFEPLRGVSKYPQLEDTMMEHFFDIAAKKLGLSDAQIKIVHCATPIELDSIFAGKLTAGDSKFIYELEKRSKWCVFWKNRKDNIEFCYDASILISLPLLAKKELTKVSQIKGSVAYKGKVKGRVCIVNGVRDMPKFKTGDILVSNCTNPSLMPVIAICSGIITDEGGIMCHAAIVSRELKKPCIIGTKVATHVLHDGDIVEIDAISGIITKF